MVGVSFRDPLDVAASVSPNDTTQSDITCLEIDFSETCRPGRLRNMRLSRDPRPRCGGGGGGVVWWLVRVKIETGG
jgi:hypothetical protein